MRAWIPLVGVAALAGCGAGHDPVPFDDGAEAVDPVQTSGATRRDPYPPAPFGTTPGAIIQNIEFLGWPSPQAAAYDPEALSLVSLAQLHDPNGAKGIRFIVLTSTAVWCSACQVEYQDFASGQVARYRAEGVEFVGALFQDRDRHPARPADLAGWAREFDVEFPFVLDPAFDLGVFFDVEATPMTMVLDARTMQILGVDVGWVSSGPYSLWAALDGLLQ